MDADLRVSLLPGTRPTHVHALAHDSRTPHTPHEHPHALAHACRDTHHASRRPPPAKR